MDNGLLSINIYFQYSFVVKEAIRTTHNACQSYSTLTAAVEPWASLCILSAVSRFDSTPRNGSWLLTERVSLRSDCVRYSNVWGWRGVGGPARRRAVKRIENPRPRTSPLAKEKSERYTVTTIPWRHVAFLRRRSMTLASLYRTLGLILKGKVSKETCWRRFRDVTWFYVVVDASQLIS